MIFDDREDGNAKFEDKIKKCIEDVSLSSKYQHKLVIFFILAGLVASLQAYCNGLFYMNPVFQCEGEEGKIFEEEACERLETCAIFNTETITAQLHLYCGQRKHQRTLLQATAAIGSAVGLVFVSLNDRIGKKVTFCSFFLILNLGWILQLVGAHFGNTMVLFASELIVGISNSGTYITFLVLLTRFLKKTEYEWGTIVWFCASHGVSHLAIAGLNAVFHDWHIIAYIYAFGIAVGSIAALLIVKEDPVYLFEFGRIQEAKRVIAEVGNLNGESLENIKKSTDQIDALFSLRTFRTRQLQNSSHKFDIGEVLRWDILKKMIIIGLAGFFNFMAGKSIDLSLQSLDYGYDFNLFIVGLANALGFISATYVIKMEPHRKRGLIYSSFLYTLIAMVILFSFCRENGNIETIVIFALHFLLCLSTSFYTRLKVDSFPEKYQMAIVSCVEFIAVLGFVLSSFVVQQSVDHRVNPIAIVAIMKLIIGTIPALFLVEGKVRLDYCEEETDRPNEALKDICE